MISRAVDGSDRLLVGLVTDVLRGGRGQDVDGGGPGSDVCHGVEQAVRCCFKDQALLVDGGL